MSLPTRLPIRIHAYDIKVGMVIIGLHNASYKVTDAVRDNDNFLIAFEAEPLPEYHTRTTSKWSIYLEPHQEVMIDLLATAKEFA